MLILLILSDLSVYNFIYIETVVLRAIANNIFQPLVFSFVSFF